MDEQEQRQDAADPEGGQPATENPTPHPDDDTFADDTPEAARPRATVGGVPREIPVRLGRYLVERVIGRGAMGAVYEARQEGLDRPVAVKVLLHGAHASDSQRHRFLREARSIAKLSHPNIVTIFEVGEYEGQPFFSMELIDGLPLDQFAREVHLESTTIIADLCATIADAVHYAHQHGIVHRDLKPGNILVDGTGRPIITDFGLAKDIDSDSLFSMAGDIMGTPAYMSPEQAAGRVDDTDPRSDVYSLGAILYVLLVRKPPFQGKTIVETLTKVLNDEPAAVTTINPRVEGELGAICAKAMEKDPARRYPDAEAFAADLRNFINGYPVTARPRSRARSLQLFVRRRRREVTAAVATVLLLALTAVLAPLFFSRSYLDVARTHLASADPAVRATAVTTLGREIANPDELDPSAQDEAAALLLGARMDDNPSVRTAVLEALAAHADAEGIAAVLGPDETAWLIAEADQRGDPKRRDLALEAMGRVSRAEFRRYLVSRLDEPNPAVRMKIVRGLGGQHSIHTVGPLIQVVNSDPVCRAEAQAALDRVYAEARFTPFPRGGSSVNAALSDLTDAMAQYNAQMESVLGEIDDRPAQPAGPLEAFAEGLRSADAATRVRASYELGMTGDRAAVPLLLEALRDADARVGAAAAFALGRVAGPEVLDELQRRVISDETPEARGNAALAMGFMHRREAVDPLLVALAREREVIAKRAMIRALGELGAPQAAAGLRAAASEDARLRKDVDEALARIGG